MRRRARTCEAPSANLDMLVLEFGCKETSMMTMTGKHNKEIRWRVAALGTEPMEIKMNIDKAPGSSPYVTINENTKKIFPTGDKSSAHLKEDFEHKWPYRAAPPNLEKEDFFEVKPKGSNDYYIANKITQRRDGSFEGHVWLPDDKLGGGWKLVHLPAIAKDDIRQRADKKPLEVPVREVILHVPKDRPLNNASLKLVDGPKEEEITHFFARVTPAPPRGSLESQPPDKSITFSVDKERTKVETACTHGMLESYLCSEAGAISAKSDGKTKMSWTVAIGPYAEHTITVERRHKTNREMTLIVDGKDLVEAKAKDFDIDDDGDDDKDDDEKQPWVCRFFFIGERSLKFKVHEETRGGIILDTTDLIEALPKEKQIFKKSCVVTITNPRDLSEAKLEVDGKLFSELKEPRKKSEDALHVSPDVLKAQYGLEVPRKIRTEVPAGLAAVGQACLEGVDNVKAAIEAGQKEGFLAGIQAFALGSKGSGKGGYSPS